MQTVRKNNADPRAKMNKDLYIAPSGVPGAGRGVFTRKAIKAGETIEECPIIIFDKEDDSHITKTMLSNYIFAYTGRASMFALGYGSLYNHSLTPNAMYELQEYEGLDEMHNELCITATKAIGKDEEIFINYGPHFDKLYGGK